MAQRIGEEEMTHKELCTLAVKWLKRPYSQGSHGCLIAADELRSGWNGEIPDAIGFRLSGNTPVSVVVEAKASRSDFFADKSKAHRITDGMGNYRYFMCPEGLIKPDELPAKWGLIYVNSRGHTKVIVGAAYFYKLAYGEHNKSLDYLFEDNNKGREMWTLIRLLSRVGDPCQVNEWIKESNRIKNYYVKLSEKQDKELKELRMKIQQLRLENIRSAA